MPRKGYKATEEHKKHISNARLGMKFTDTTKQKLRNINLGKHLTKEHKENIRKARLGKSRIPFTEEHKKHIGEANIGRKMTDQQRQKMSIDRAGNKTHLWKGGISFKPYCPKFNRNLKHRVREFFNNTCVNCGTQSKSLCVHHVTYDKETCCNDKPPKFVALCRSCHTKTNHNRETWNKKFEELINTIYNGKCYYTQEEMLA